MIDSINSYWQKLTEDKKLFLIKLGFASIALYVALQLLSLLLPIFITGAIGLWVYKNLINPNPKVLK